MSVRVRIAPSPTGDPHVGTAYIGLFNYVFAKNNNGKFILRIEDTDQSRCTKESEEAIFHSLKWLGINWDEGPDIGGPYGPYRQSERLEIYKEHAKILIQRDKAYYCFCSPERLDQIREKQKEEKQSIIMYDRHCRNLSKEEVEENLKNGKPYVIRLKIPTEGETVVKDYLRGEISFQNNAIDDQILIKSDGFPTYHLANVVDDHLMKITHVIRAEEWIPSTPKHIILYDAFGWEYPVFIHMPLLRNKDRSKISKRKNPVSLTYYERAGYLPEAMVNFLALMGWAMPDEREKFTIDEFAKEINFSRISLGGPIFDLEKLNWLNGLYIRSLSYEELLQRIKKNILNDDYLSKIIPLIHQRIEKLEDFIPMTSFFFEGSLNYDLNLVIPKKKTKEELITILEKLSAKLDEQYEWKCIKLEELFRKFCEETGWKTKEFFMPIRIIMTGKSATPPLFETMEVLGREICRRRLNDAILRLKNFSPSSF